MKKPKPAEYKKNSYSDDDLRDLIEEIEDFEAHKVTIRATAAGECGGISKKIAVVKGRAKDLAIPLAILNGLLKTRKLERQIEAVGQGIPEDLAEVWVDATTVFGQFGDTPLAQAAVTAANDRLSDVRAAQEEEQAEGARVLDELAGVH